MKIWISLLKFKFSQILQDDKDATSLCSKIISTLFSDALLNFVWFETFARTTVIRNFLKIFDFQKS